MISFIIVGFIIIGSILLGFIVLINNPNNRLNQLFFIFAKSNTLWAIVNIMTGLSPSHFWVRSMYGTGALVITSALVWAIYLLDRKLKILKTIILFGIALFFLYVSLFTNLIIQRIDLIHFGYFDGKFGLLFPVYTLLFASVLIYLEYILIKGVTKSSGLKRIQLTYVSVGITFFGIAALILSFILPNANVLIFSQFDLLGSFICLLCIAYSILKYRLMDIRLILSKSILYFILVILVALSFTFVTISSAQFFQGRGQVAVTLVVSLIIVILLDPLKKFLAKLTDKFFYKGKIDYQAVLMAVGQVIAKELDLERLLKILEAELEKSIKLKKIDILIAQNGEFRGHKTLDTNRFLNLTNDGPILSYLKTYRRVVVTEELPRRKTEIKDPVQVQLLDTLEKRLDELGIALAAPILVENELTGLFLIEGKLSGSAFTQEDLDFFDILAPQVATALEKSKLFAEVQLAKLNLEQLVEQRTKDLKERNRYLIALQGLINLITRSLDFQKVMQTIADGISAELGYIGGILNFINPESKTISIRAISNTSKTREVVKLVPTDITKYSVALEQKDNLAIKAIINKEITFSHRMYDFFKPAIPLELADKLQQALGAKSVFAVPIYTEEKVIGVIDFVLVKQVADVTSIEKEMMKSLADQVGIVYRNLSLYQEIQKANVDLKEANIRLQQLDNAKSEFLSIASHQLRTPLTGIKGYLSMMLEGDFGHLPVKLKTVIEDVFENTDRLTRLVNIFLNVSRIESGRFELDRTDVDLKKLIEEVVAEFSPNAERKDLKLHFKEPGVLLPYMSLDRDKLKDVLVNLVDNAIKYTKKGKIEVILEKEKNEIKVTIKDTGIGIDKEEVGNLFKKFVRGDGIAQINTGGSGLGLYIAKKIVEAHNGRIWVESDGKDKGSEFIFTLPIK